MSTFIFDKVAEQEISLKGEITFDNVAKLYQKSQSQLLNGITTFDLFNVSTCDSSAVMLLIALKRFAKQKGQPIYFKQCPEQMLAIARVCEVSDFLKN